MTNTLIVLLSGVLLCGCSQKQASSTGSAIDLVQAGKDITAFSGRVIHITKRDGTSLKGIQIITTGADGQKTTITADTGTMTQGSVENAADNSSVRFILHNVKSQNAKGQMTGQNLMIVLHE